MLSGRDGPSVLEQETGFQRVMQQLERERAPRRWRLWAPATAMIAAAAAAVLLFARAPGVEPPFAARGGGGGHAALQVLCVEHGASGRCPSGGRLAFVAESDSHRYLALFVRRGDGLVIWYLPSSGGTSAPIADQAGKPLRHGAQLGADQPPGEYEVFGVFSSTPLTREEIKRDLGPELRSSAHRVVRQPFVVEPRP